MSALLQPVAFGLKLNDNPPTMSMIFAYYIYELWNRLGQIPVNLKCSVFLNSLYISDRISFLY